MRWKAGAVNGAGWPGSGGVGVGIRWKREGDGEGEGELRERVECGCDAVSGEGRRVVWQASGTERQVRQRRRWRFDRL